MDEITIGPTVTRYALKPAEGVRLQKIVSLQTNLELALAAHPVRIEAPIPGKSLVGIEVPNMSKATVGLAELIGAKEFSESDKPLLFALGRGISGRSYYTDLSKAPHLLVAGTTGSGKSVALHAIITSFLYRNGPQSLKFIMVDPKRVELSMYNGIPHLITPVITNAKKTIMALKWAVKEMERRYQILESEGRQSIVSYHEHVVKPAIEKKLTDEEAPDPMPYIVIIIDELGDLMQVYPKELESEIIRLAQMSRAVGIHLILTTQRPSKQVITGLIKANVPSRIALQVASNMESRIILDSGGAEHLLGAGDMLYQSAEMSKPSRIQSAFISEKEVKGVASYLQQQYEGELPDEIDVTAPQNHDTIFDADIMRDETLDNDDSVYEEAREAVIKAGKASTSYLQRRLRIGYSRAARIMDQLEQEGVIGPQDGARPRDVLIRENDSSSE
jgi:S-DNA-T family DNA segregation ATPase FtsK/SpoIIIE